MHLLSQNKQKYAFNAQTYAQTSRVQNFLRYKDLFHSLARVPSDCLVTAKQIYIFIFLVVDPILMIIIIKQISGPYQGTKR